MLYKTKTSLADHLGVHRETINRMIDRGEIKQVKQYKKTPSKSDNSYYVLVIDFIKYLVT